MQEPILYKTYTSPQKWFEFRYPSYWESIVIEGIPAFFDPNGSGALQIYSLVNKENIVEPEKELENYLHFHKIEYEKNLVAKFENNEGTTILSCEFKKEDRHWCVYSLGNLDKFILATYNSDVDISDALYSQLTSTISSIKIF